MLNKLMILVTQTAGYFSNLDKFENEINRWHPT
jgi:hypothetical protein